MRTSNVRDVAAIKYAIKVYARKCVAEAPALTAVQRDAIACILRSAPEPLEDRELGG